MYASAALQAAHSALVNVHVSTVNALLQAKDAEIARLQRLNGETPKDVPTVHVPTEVVWDERNDPLQSHVQVLRQQYGYVNGMNPAQKRVVIQAVERYLRLKMGRVLYNSKGKMGIPSSLHADFVAWFGNELDTGLLDCVLVKTKEKRMREKDKDNSSEEESDGHDDESVTKQSKRKITPARPTMVDDMVTEDNFTGWKPWPWVLRDLVPDFYNDVAKNSPYIKIFCLTHELPLKQMKGTRNVQTRAIPEQFHDQFVQYITSINKFVRPVRAETRSTNPTIHKSPPPIVVEESPGPGKPREDTSRISITTHISDEESADEPEPTGSRPIGTSATTESPYLGAISKSLRETSTRSLETSHSIPAVIRIPAAASSSVTPAANTPAPRTPAHETRPVTTGTPHLSAISKSIRESSKKSSSVGSPFTLPVVTPISAAVTATSSTEMSKSPTVLAAKTTTYETRTLPPYASKTTPRMKRHVLGEVSPRSQSPPTSTKSGSGSGLGFTQKIGSHLRNSWTWNASEPASRN